MKRSLKTEENFDRYKIREYQYWDLFLHQSQYFLGRTYLWAKREDAVDFFKMTNEEQNELFRAGKEVQAALTKLFRPDRINCAALGNEANHLHIHIIPRYRTKRTFEGFRFKDERWGKNYAPYNKEFKVPEEILMEIRDRIGETLYLSI